MTVAAARLDGAPRILAIDRMTLPVGARDPAQAQTQLGSLATELCSRFVQAYGATDHAAQSPIGAIEIHLGAAFVEADTATHVTRFADSTVVTDAHIAEAAKSASGTLPPTQRSVVESNVIRVHVNGYPTARPAGKRAAHMSVTVFRSLCDESFRNALGNAVSAALPGHEPVFRSFARDLMFVLKEYATDPYHLIIDLEDEASHCIALRRDDIAAHATVPMGTSTLLTKMSGEGSIDETRTLVRLAARDACSTAACEGIKAKLAAVEPQLVKSFGDAFAMLSSTYRLPNATLILCEEDLQPWLENAFSRLDFAQFTVTSQPLAVAPFHTILRGSVQTDAPADPWLETAALAAALYTKPA